MAQDQSSAARVLVRNNTHVMGDPAGQPMVLAHGFVPNETNAAIRTFVDPA